jgi:hypothetical protein
VDAVNLLLVAWGLALALLALGALLERVVDRR